MHRHRGIILALGLFGLTAGCFSNEKLNSPSAPTGGTLFSRMVFMGNSITAGFQSAGINDSTQRQSYAFLVAQAAGAPYYYASLQGRGCPAPFDDNSTQHRVGGGGPTDCDLRAPTPLPWLSNVAVPGARTVETFDNFATPVSASNALTTFILGGRTQVQAMRAANPTLVTVWIGANDVLASLTNSGNPGTPLAVTPSDSFNAEYDILAAQLDSSGAKVVLIGVPNVTDIPYTSPGAIYWCLKNAPACGPAFGASSPFPPTFAVTLSCAPGAAVPGEVGDSILVPWTVGVPLIGAAALGQSDTLDCANDLQVVTAAEHDGLNAAVDADNAKISAVAAAHHWAYFDPNPTLLALKADPTKVAPFPSLPGTTGNPGPNVLFGSMFTLDGVHPSAAAHKIIADSLVATINTAYGTSVPLP
ncbi:MAG TPA: SGNH/GDSL hydrolase family protein [Gemmatimonadales bacterium]|nr:SGNH/GDSL hydrolase family protein [Gemmatimonadales bacterium]